MRRTSTQSLRARGGGPSDIRYRLKGELDGNKASGFIDVDLLGTGGCTSGKQDFKVKKPSPPLPALAPRPRAISRSVQAGWNSQSQLAGELLERRRGKRRIPGTESPDGSVVQGFAKGHTSAAKSSENPASARMPRISSAGI